MLFGEKKKIDFLIENDLMALSYSEVVVNLFTIAELMEFEIVADKIKARFKTINKNLSSKEKEVKKFTYEDMKKYFRTIMLEYYGDKLIEKLEAKCNESVGRDRERLEDSLEHEKKVVKVAKINAPKYRKKITEVIEQIVIKKKAN